MRLASGTVIADNWRSSGTQTRMRCMSWTAWSSLHRPACAGSHQPSLSKRSPFAAGHVKEVTHRKVQHHSHVCANSRRRTEVQAGSTAPAKSRPGKASSRKKASVVGSPQVDFQLKRNLLDKFANCRSHRRKSGDCSRLSCPLRTTLARTRMKPV